MLEFPPRVDVQESDCDLCEKGVVGCALWVWGRDGGAISDPGDAEGGVCGFDQLDGSVDVPRRAIVSGFIVARERVGV